MRYARWGGRPEGPLVSRLGFGTTRFRPQDLGDASGLDRCEALVAYAIEKGINYFDVAPTYSYGFAEEILGRAFSKTADAVYVAAKSGLMIDKTGSDILNRIENSMRVLRRDHLDFYHIWSVMNLKEYNTILAKGGLYEGVLEAKKRGYIKHICISLHCSPDDALKIVEDGFFEGITISMNAMNYRKWLPVVKAAKERSMAVATMNSLAGGVIPRYARLFERLDESGDPVAVKALRFLRDFPEVDVALSGMASLEEIDENCRPFEEITADSPRQLREFQLPVKEALCTGCGYCAPCTVGIPISACMQAYNHKTLIESSGETLSPHRLANEIFTAARASGAGFIDQKPCVSCRVCEKRCTQKINISERMRFLETAARKYRYTKAAILSRLQEIEIMCAGSERVGIWPACDYATRTLDLWNNPEFEQKCLFFNASEAMKGKAYRGKTVHGPDELISLGVDTVVIMHYRLQESIYEDLKEKFADKLRLIKLHSEEDIDWFNRAMS